MNSLVKFKNLFGHYFIRNKHRNRWYYTDGKRWYPEKVTVRWYKALYLFVRHYMSDSDVEVFQADRQYVIKYNYPLRK